MFQKRPYFKSQKSSKRIQTTRLLAAKIPLPSLNFSRDISAACPIQYSQESSSHLSVTLQIVRRRGGFLFQTKSQKFNSQPLSSHAQGPGDLKTLVHLLPEQNSVVLEKLLGTLHLISLSKDVNKQTTKLMGVIFGLNP